ncbi:MAG: diphthine--ammonia ligase [Clostridiales bacterium]|nr:diphthine--ammonia ligase [Clostridiales bacterium]
MQFVISHSGGKDSALALCRMAEQGHRPVAMITTVNRAQQRSWSHGMHQSLMIAVSESLGIPSIFCECTAEDYAQSFARSLADAKALGAEACVFGDIDIEGHKAWNEGLCHDAGLSCLLPLWQQGREALVREALDRGIRALIKVIDKRQLDASYLGQDLTWHIVEKMKAAGVDPCGENGEYHTFAYDGPGFAHPIAFEAGEVVDLGDYQAIDLRV